MDVGTNRVHADPEAFGNHVASETGGLQHRYFSIRGLGIFTTPPPQSPGPTKKGLPSSTRSSSASTISARIWMSWRRVRGRVAAISLATPRANPADEGDRDAPRDHHC